MNSYRMGAEGKYDLNLAACNSSTTPHANDLKVKVNAAVSKNKRNTNEVVLFMKTYGFFSFAPNFSALFFPFFSIFFHFFGILAVFHCTDTQVSHSNNNNHSSTTATHQQQPQPFILYRALANQGLRVPFLATRCQRWLNNARATPHPVSATTNFLKSPP